MSQDGKAVIFCAPSGAGKTTIVKNLLEQREDLSFSISATTRNKRPNEVDGKDYYFHSEESFKSLMNKGALLEWEEVYDGIFYGSLKSELDRLWRLGKTVVFDVDVEGGLTIKNHLGDAALAVFVQVSDIKTLEERLQSRGTENEETLSMRLSKARQEMGYASKFDEILINDNLSEAFEKAEKLVADFIGKHK